MLNIKPKFVCSQTAPPPLSMCLLPLMIVLFLLPPLNLAAQPKSILDKTVFVDNTERFYAESYVVPARVADSSQIVVIFRMSNDFLSFTKASTQNARQGAFQATMAVSMEVRDSLGVIRQRIRNSSTVYTNSFEETNDKNSFRYGWQTITVPPGMYKITLEVLDRGVGQPKRLTLNDVTFHQNGQSTLITSPIFARPVPSKDRLLLRPYVLSGNVGFGPSDALALLQVADTSAVQYEYRIRQQPYGARDIRWWSVDEITGQASRSVHRRLRLSEFANSRDPFLEVIDSQEESSPIALIEVPLPVTMLVPGSYVLTVVAVGSSDSLTMPFNIVWESMPMSLRNLDYAMKMLKYTVKESVLDSLNSGNDVERRMHLMGWWRLNDGSPTSTYNERMAEYYKRVDQAFAAFSTIQESDGADTERAKVYILFGPPTTVDKHLSPNNEPQEEWTYSNSVKKTFTFTMDQGGIYKLVAITPIEK